MDVREKLAELIESARYWGSNTSEEIAENLIANGATVQEWISVKDRLPEAGGYVVCIAKRNPFSRFMPMVARSETIREYERQNPTEKVKIGDETFKRLDAELTDLFIKVALI